MKLIKPIYAKITNTALDNKDIGDGKAYFNNAIQTVISILFIFGIIYFIVHFVLGAFHMISSQGDPKKYEEAQHSLLYALMGLGIIFSVFMILSVVGYIFGITDLDKLKISWPNI